MRFIVDMNLSPAWVTLLREAGHEADHWSSVGDVTATDVQIMAVASEQGAIVLTNDLDFGSILAATGTTGPSVIQIRAADLRLGAFGELLLLAIERVAGQAPARGVTADPSLEGQKAALSWG